MQCPGRLGSCSQVRPLGALPRLCGVLGHLAAAHGCARSVCCVACAVSWATWAPFTGVPARFVVLRVRCPGPVGSCSPVRLLSLSCCVYGVLGPLAPVHRGACSVCSVGVRCPGPLGLYSPVCPLGVLCCVCGVLGHLAPVHRCAHSVCRVACTVSWAPWLLFTGVHARCAVLGVRCPGPSGSCSPVCLLGGLCGCAVSGAPYLLFTGVPARCVVLRLRCPAALGSCSPVRPLGLSCCVYGVLGHLAPVHRSACSVCCVGCAVSWAPRLLFTGVPACWAEWVCGVLGPLPPVHRCARSVCCVACAVSWAPWLLFTGAPAPFAVLRVRCLGPPGSCSPVCPLGVLCPVCGVLAHLALVHRCARSVYCVAHTVSWPLGSCSPVCSLGVVCCVLCVRGRAAGRALFHLDGGCS